jgi:hypothetical protein
MVSPRSITMASDAHTEHMRYLDEVSAGDDPLITSITATLAAQAWEQVRAATGDTMPVPSACTGPDGQMFYGWDRGRHHLELEIIPGKPADYFYRDRQTNECWGEEYTVGDPLPGPVLAILSYFTKSLEQAE